MDYVIGLSERSQHPRNFKGDGYKLKYPYNIKICRSHLYGLKKAEYCKPNVLAYKRLAAQAFSPHITLHAAVHRAVSKDI